ncbi:MAG: hypothetical protein ABFD07_09345, partial [Methanobacterium sp.]
MFINSLLLKKFGWQECTNSIQRTRYFTTSSNIDFIISEPFPVDIKYFYYEFFIIQNPKTMAYFFVIVKDNDIKKKE